MSNNIPKKVFDKACQLAIINFIRMDDFKKDIKEDINGVGAKVDRYNRRLWYVLAGILFVAVEGIIVLVK